MDLDKGMTELPLCRLVDLANSADCCHVAPGIGNDEQLGHFYVDNDFPVIPPGLPEEVYEVLDYAAIAERPEWRRAESSPPKAMWYSTPTWM